MKRNRQARHVAATFANTLGGRLGAVRTVYGAVVTSGKQMSWEETRYGLVGFRWMRALQVDRARNKGMMLVIM